MILTKLSLTMKNQSRTQRLDRCVTALRVLAALRPLLHMSQCKVEVGIQAYSIIHIVANCNGGVDGVVFPHYNDQSGRLYEILHYRCRRRFSGQIKACVKFKTEHRNKKKRPAPCQFLCKTGGCYPHTDSIINKTTITANHGSTV